MSIFAKIKIIFMKRIKIKLGYSPDNQCIGKQLGYIKYLLDRNGYGDAYEMYITRYNTVNPFNRLTISEGSKLIDALLDRTGIEFYETHKFTV
jgi:hypothetical protein